MAKTTYQLDTMIKLSEESCITVGRSHPGLPEGSIYEAGNFPSRSQTDGIFLITVADCVAICRTAG